MMYLTNTFSPMMVSKSLVFKGIEISLDEARTGLDTGFTSAISHEITSKILSALLDMDVVFNRVNLNLSKGDIVICIIPNFRSDIAREFSFDEIFNAGFRCFYITIS